MVKNNASAVGKTVTTESGHSFEVIDHNGKTGNHSRHLFHCPRCAKDPELFGDGNFWSRLHSLTYRSAPPCGCAYSPRWTEEQCRVRCERAARCHGLLFKGWVGEYKGCYTRVSLYCPDHGEIKSKTINNLVNQNQGCRKCYEVRIRESAMSDKEAEEKYLPLCGYPEGSTLRRIKHAEQEGRRNKFVVYCPKCGNDEYAHAGLCDGVFITNSEALCSGEKSCRCSITKRKPEKIARFQCVSVLNESGFDFISWLSEYNNTNSKIIAFCPKHGLFYPTAQQTLKGHLCPNCGIGGYKTSKPGQLYLLASECNTMMKVGITNNFEKRQKELIASTPFTFDVLAVRDMQGPAAPVLERKILERSNRLGLTGFGGATEWIEYDESVLDYFQ